MPPANRPASCCAGPSEPLMGVEPCARAPPDAIRDPPPPPPLPPPPPPLPPLPALAATVGAERSFVAAFLSDLPAAC
jgi:hypothetical protein